MRKAMVIAMMAPWFLFFLLLSLCERGYCLVREILLRTRHDAVPDTHTWRTKSIFDDY